MDDISTNPIIVALLFIARCLVPLVVLFGISYLLRRLGLVTKSPEPPEEPADDGNHHNSGEGGMAHDKA
jgi:hypothetical protein